MNAIRAHTFLDRLVLRTGPGLSGYVLVGRRDYRLTAKEIESKPVLVP